MKSRDLQHDFMHFSYSNQTNCINLSDLSLIEKNIIDIFKKEDFIHIHQPPLPKNNRLIIKEFASNPGFVNSFLLIVGLVVGNFGWTIIKTSNPGLFYQKSKNAPDPLLSKLAMANYCDAFHHTIVDRNWGVLLEVNCSGEVRASGDIEADYLEDIKFYTKNITKPKNRKNFLILNVPEEFQTAGRITISLRKEEKQRKEEQLEEIYQQGTQEQRKQAWLEWKELNMSFCERVDEDLGKLLCKSDSFWHENNLLYRAYAEPEKLEKDGVRLLFFSSRRI